MKWVKLKESDAIVKLVAPDGSLVEGVAKGIRKPKSSTSSKLEPFNCVEVFLARGKSLDVIKDCKLLRSNERIREDPCKFACASCLGELFYKTVQEDVEVPNAYDLFLAYLDTLGNDADTKMLCLTSAAILKACAYLGFMPSFDRCVFCGDVVDGFEKAAFSFPDGGVICGDCRARQGLSSMDVSTVAFANAFMRMRFADIEASDFDEATGAKVLRFANTWLKTQTGVTLKAFPLALQMCPI